MTRNIIAILLIIVGVVCIAGGIWGLSMQIGSDVDPNLLGVAQTVLGYADGAVDSADAWLSDVTGGRVTMTGILNSAVGDTVDLTSDWSVKSFVFWHATEILLGGIIGVETGLLLFKFGKR